MHHFISRNLRWLAAGILLCLCSSFGQTFFISLYANEIRAEFALSHGEFGSLYMLATLGAALVLVWFGRLVDVTTVSKSVAIVMTGLAACCVAMAFNRWGWCLLPVLLGLRLFGQGMMPHTAMTAMGRWYSANRGRAVAIASTGLQIGEAVMPLAFVSLLALAGWRAGWMVAAFLLIVLALPLALWLLRLDRTPRTPRADSGTQTGRQWTRREVLRDRLFWPTLSSMLCLPFIGTVLFFYQTHLVELNGWTMQDFASSYIVMAITTIVSTLASGWAIDRFSATRLLPLALLPLALTCLAFAAGRAAWVAPLAMGCFGIGYGLSASVQGALWPEIYGTRNLGAIRSIIVAVMTFATALGPGVTGLLIDLGIAYKSQLYAMAVVSLCATVTLFQAGRALMDRQGAASVAQQHL